MQPFCIGPVSPRSFVVSTTTGNAVSPIVVTTTLPHSFAAGDIVTLVAVGGNTAAVGTWVAQQVTPTTVALFNSQTGLPSMGNGAYSAGGTISAPTQLSYAANDNLAGNRSVARIHWSTAVTNTGTGTFAGIAGLNQSTFQNVIREMNKNSAATGRIDFYDLGFDTSVMNLTDYWVDCIVPTDIVMCTYWRA
jgi:hypothetical protein